MALKSILYEAFDKCLVNAGILSDPHAATNAGVQRADQSHYLGQTDKLRHMVGGKGNDKGNVERASWSAMPGRNFMTPLPRS